MKSLFYVILFLVACSSDNDNDTDTKWFDQGIEDGPIALVLTLSQPVLLSGYVLYTGKDNIVRGTKNLFEALTEQDIFAALGLEYVEPTMRNTDVKGVGALPALK